MAREIRSSWYSVQGREIKALASDPESTETIGGKIKDLGQDMIDSAKMLQDVAEGDVQQGKAVDKLRDLTGDAYKLLAEAGEMYRATGDVIETFGRQSGRHDDEFLSINNNAREAWHAYYDAPGDRDLAGDTEGKFGREIDESDQADNSAKQKLYEEYEKWAVSFDAEFDAWKPIYTTAKRDLDDALDNGVEDDWKDRLDSFVDGLQTALTIAGFVLGVLAIVLGGPFAIAALIVGALAVLATGWQWYRGDAGPLDMALAVVGILPFGKLGGVWKAGGEAMEGAGDVGKFSKSFTGFKAGFKESMPKFSDPAPFRGLKAGTEGRFQTTKFDDFVHRFATGRPVSDVGAFDNAGFVPQMLNGVDVLYNTFGNPAQQIHGFVGTINAFRDIPGDFRYANNNY